MNRITLLSITLFSTALLLYWQVQSKRTQEQLKLTDDVKPDYIARDLKTLEYNELGLLNSKVTAAHMEHFEAQDTTYFNQPIYWIYPDDGQAQWRLQAAHGKLHKNANKVILEKDVIIDAISPEEPVKTIKTTYLELDLKTMIITSDQSIYIHGDDFFIEGTGLYGDLNAQQVQLTSQVKGTYKIEQQGNN